MLRLLEEMVDCRFQLVVTQLMVDLMPVEVSLTGRLLRWEGTSNGAERVAVEAPVQWRSLRRNIHTLSALLKQ